MKTFRILLALFLVQNPAYSSGVSHKVIKESYFFQKNDTLSEVLYKRKKENQRLWGKGQLVEQHKTLNPQINDWSRVPVGAKVLLLGTEQTIAAPSENISAPTTTSPHRTGLLSNKVSVQRISKSQLPKGFILLGGLSSQVSEAVEDITTETNKGVNPNLIAQAAIYRAKKLNVVVRGEINSAKTVRDVELPNEYLLSAQVGTMFHSASLRSSLRPYIAAEVQSFSYLSVEDATRPESVFQKKSLNPYWVSLGSDFGWNMGFTHLTVTPQISYTMGVQGDLGDGDKTIDMSGVRARVNLQGRLGPNSKALAFLTLERSDFSADQAELDGQSISGGLGWLF